MKKIKSRCSRIIFVSVYLLFYFSTLTGSVLADYTLDMREFTSFAAAFETLPEDAGAVSMILPSNFSDAEMIIPAGRGITSLSIVPPAEPGSAYLPDIIRICANGGPLTVGEGILLENASIYGGACVSGGDVQLASSEVTISGKTAFVFGGGFADGGGRSTVTETAVTLTESGQVYLEVFGGGHAYEPESRASVGKTNVTVRGTADYVLGGGFSEDGGLSECDQTNVVTEEGSTVNISLFSGGSASGAGSRSIVQNAKAVLGGKAGWAFSGDFAYGGGSTRLEKATRLEILKTGVSETAYTGSFSSDPGSDAYVYTSELMNCGTVGFVREDGQAVDQGKAVTLIKSQSTCKSGN